jgi:hypothetical protein
VVADWPLCSQAHGESAVAVTREVVVNVQRVDAAAVFEHDPLLLGQVRVRWGRRTQRVPRLPTLQLFYLPSHAGRDAVGANVPAGDLAGGLRGHIAIQCNGAIRFHHFHQRLTMAHSVAAHRFDNAVGARLLRGALERIAHRLGAAGYAAGTESDPNLDCAALHAVRSLRSASFSASHAVAGVSLPAVWPSTMSTGARLQQPRQATSSTVNWRAASVSSPSGIAR